MDDIIIRFESIYNSTDEKPTKKLLENHKSSNSDVKPFCCNDICKIIFKCWCFFLYY